MDNERIAIATSTFYNPKDEIDRSRMNLAINTVREARDLGYQVVVVDGGSSNEFLDQLSRFGAHIEMEKERGMGKGRRQAIAIASDLGEIVSWTEPEKQPYISQIQKVVQPILTGEANIVIPARKSLESYPTSQQHAENFGNSFFYELTGHKLDVWIGPRVFGREDTHYFTDYNGEYGDKWDSIFIPVLNAIHDGRKVIGKEIDYVHPVDQKRLEEGNVKYTIKRLDQLNNLVTSMRAHWDRLSRT